ncbi:MAG: DUF1616 domain-containing protein [Dehalococcoidales bacterium]
MDWIAPIRQITDFMLPFLDGVPAVRALLGLAVVFFLPGFAWTLVFFEKINLLERSVLSVGLSIAVVTLSILALNLLLGISINGLNSLLIIVVVTILPVAFHYLRKILKRNQPEATSPNAE